MNKLFGPDSWLVVLLTKLGNLIFLNLLWIAGCIPIITIGTSTAALYRCVMKYRQEQEISLFREFAFAYRLNFKKATALFAIMAGLSAIVIAEAHIVLRFHAYLGTLGVLGFTVLAMLVLMTCGYLLPLQAQFENTVGQTLKNAWKLAVLHLPKSFVVMTLNLLPVLLVLWPKLFFRCVPILIFCGGSVIAYINAIILQSVFEKYVGKIAQET